MNAEVWKSVIGYEGLYEVSDQGKVRSACDRIRGLRKGCLCKVWHLQNKYCQKNGYCQVYLFKNGHRKGKLIHRLVLEAFVGFCPKGMETRHLNDVKTDNRLVNLRWGTRKENTADRRINKIAVGHVKGKYKHSIETRRKISIAHTGKKHSTKTRRKMRASHLKLIGVQ